jgi:hypothetical protein
MSKAATSTPFEFQNQHVGSFGLLVEDNAVSHGGNLLNTPALLGISQRKRRLVFRKDF